MMSESIEFWKERTQGLRVGTLCDIHVYCESVKAPIARGNVTPTCIMFDLVKNLTLCVDFLNVSSKFRGGPLLEYDKPKIDGLYNPHSTRLSRCPQCMLSF